MKKFILLCSILFFIFSCKNDKSRETNSEKEEVKPTSEAISNNSNKHPTTVYWGDTHLHTGLSMDAGLFGNSLGLDEAYRFAKGQAIKSSTGLDAKLSRPLDFLVVADHSDGMGLFQSIQAGEDWVMKTEQGKRWNTLLKEGKGADAALELIKAFSQKSMDMDPNDKELQKSVWTMQLVLLS